MNIIEALNNDDEFAVTNSNSAAFDMLKQIILVDSGAIALVGALVANKDPIRISLPIKILLTVAITMLVVSIVTAIIQYLVEHKFFERIHDTILNIKETLPQDQAKQDSYRLQKLNEIKTKSNSVALWMSVVSFLCGALVLSAVIITLIWKLATNFLKE